MSDAKKLEVIGYVLDRHRAACETEGSLGNLRDTGYVVEAIDAALAGHAGNPILRMFTGADNA